MLHCASVAETDEMKSRVTGENKTLGKKLVAVPLDSENFQTGFYNEKPSSNCMGIIHADCVLLICQNSHTIFGF
jgi:hypothetical protein